MSKSDKEFDLEEAHTDRSEKGGNGHEDLRTGSSFGAYFNIVCVLAGTGILGLPYAMKGGGWAVVVLFVLTGIVAIYTGKLLIECLYYKPGERLEEFPDIGEVTFGKFGRYFVKFFHYSILLSAACIFILLTGSNVYDMIHQVTGKEYLSLEMWIFLAGCLVLIPSVTLKSLKEVAILAVFGALSTLFVVFCVVIMGALDYNNVDFVPPPTRSVVWEGFPLSLATIAFSYGGNVVYPHVESTMRYPKSWNKVLFAAITTVTMMYAVMGIAGYLYYGENVKSPILKSLPDGVGSLLAYAIITLHVVLTGPIFVCSFSLEQENWLKIDRKYMSAPKEFLYRAVLRTFVVGILTVIAIFVPFFSELMSLIGAVSNCIIVFLVPVACHFKLFGWRGRPIWEYPLALIVVVVGILGLILGTKDSVITLIERISMDKQS